MDFDMHEYAEGTYAIMQSTHEEKEVVRAIVMDALNTLDEVDRPDNAEFARRCELTARVFGEKTLVRGFMLLQYIFRIIPGLCNRYFKTGFPFDRDLLENAGQDLRSTILAYALAAASDFEDGSPLVKALPNIPGKIVDDYKEHRENMKV